MLWAGVIGAAVLFALSLMVARAVWRNPEIVERRRAGLQQRSSAVEWVLAGVMLVVLVGAIVLRAHGLLLKLGSLIEVLCVAAFLRVRSRA